MPLLSNILTLYFSVVLHVTNLKVEMQGSLPRRILFKKFSIELYLHNGKADLKVWGLGSLGHLVLHGACPMPSSQLPCISNTGGRRVRVSFGRRSFSSLPLHLSCWSRLTGMAGSPNHIARTAILEEAERFPSTLILESDAVRRFVFTICGESQCQNLPVQAYTPLFPLLLGHPIQLLAVYF